MAPFTSGVSVGFKTTPIDVDWTTLDEIWAAAGEIPAFSAAWMADHLTNATLDRGGRSFEALTLAATLAHRVPGKWIGHAVLSNTFRHPAVLAKAATVLDHATGGRFIVGLGAGWHEGEHDAFGIPLPRIGERIDRLESAVAVLHALFGPDARQEPGVTLDDRHYPLHEATNLPAPVSRNGPPIWLGGQKRRGIALAARSGDGWIMPGNRTGDTAYLTGKRDELVWAIEAAGRDPETFSFAGQVVAGSDARSRRSALDGARSLVSAGAQHIVVGIVPAEGPAALLAAAREIAEPLLEGSR